MMKSLLLLARLSLVTKRPQLALLSPRVLLSPLLWWSVVLPSPVALRSPVILLRRLVLPWPRLLLLPLALLSPLAMAAANSTDSTAPRVPDTMAERVKACTACHSIEGKLGRDAYYPRLAGKPAGYLYDQLLNFREGRRHYRPMSLLLENLSDDYLMEMARHFAAMPQPTSAPQGSNIPAAELEPGRRLVMEGDPARKIPACVACHGKALTGVTPSIPALVGLPRDYIRAQIGAWRNGLRSARAPDCMAEISKQLTAEDIGAIAMWLAAQPVAPGARPAASLPEEPPVRCGALERGRGKP